MGITINRASGLLPANRVAGWRTGCFAQRNRFCRGIVPDPDAGSFQRANPPDDSTGPFWNHSPETADGTGLPSWGGPVLLGAVSEFPSICRKPPLVNWSAYFQSALTYDQFLAAHGTEIDRHKWANVLQGTVLTESQIATLGSFVRQMKVLCFSGAWCGDCVEHCPIFQTFAQHCPQIELRFIDRDTDAQLKSELTICGAARVPQTILLSEDMEFVARLGDRPLSKYRELAAKISGAACSTGMILAGDPLRAEIIQDWLNDFERAQLTLRTSPKLRQRHGD